MAESIGIERNTVKEWLSRPFIWRIPVYQRHYSWDVDDDSGPVHLFWETLREQYEKRLKGETPPPHYLGAILVDEKNLGSTSAEKEFDVVDGQQRLTTIQVALAALIQSVEDADDKSNLQNDLEKYFFCGSDKNKRKLNPTNFDYPQYRNLILYVYDELTGPKPSSAIQDNSRKSKIENTFRFFQRKMTGLFENVREEQELKKHIRALQETILEGFELVLIILKDTDEAQVVFASMNNTAKPLTTFDLIRNDVFHRASKQRDGDGLDVELFNSSIWQQLEKPFWERSSGRRRTDKLNTHIEAYIARMLVAKLMKGDIKFNRADIFETYKEFSRGYQDVKEEIKSMTEYAGIYQYLSWVRTDETPESPVNPVSGSFEFGVFRFCNWPNRDFYPVIFRVVKSDEKEDEKQQMLNLLESFVVRRNISGLSSENYNKTASSLCRELETSINYNCLRDILLKHDADTSRFPDDVEVRDSCVNNTKFYTSPFQYYVLEEIDKWLYESQEERVFPENLTVDHMLPKGWEKNKNWEDWFEREFQNFTDGERGSKRYEINSILKTIGNLTLMSSEGNARKSNRSFGETKEFLENSGLKMNREIAKKDKWTPDEIRERSEELARIICERWPYPNPT